MLKSFIYLSKSKAIKIINEAKEAYSHFLPEFSIKEKTEALIKIAETLIALPF